MQEGAPVIEGQIIRNKKKVTAPAVPFADAGAEAEAYAGRILEALDLIASSSSVNAREAERHLDRICFSIERARDLRELAGAERGAFAPARLDVGIAILEGSVGMAAGFVARAMAVKRPPRPVRDLAAAVDTAVAAVTDAEEMAA